MKYEDRIGKLYWYPAISEIPGALNRGKFLFMVVGVQSVETRREAASIRYKAESYGVSETHWSKPFLYLLADNFNYIEAG